MASPRLSLRPVGFELYYGNAHRNARPAVVAIRPIGKRPATAKSQPHQVAVNAAVDQVTRRRDLGSRQPIGQVAARVRRSGIKLQRRQRKIVELGHGRSASPGGAWFQGSAS